MTTDSLDYEVRRRQVKHRPESLAQQGPVPIDLSTLQSADLYSLSEAQLEEAVLALRKGGGKKGKRKKGKGKGKDKVGKASAKGQHRHENITID